MTDLILNEMLLVQRVSAFNRDKGTADMPC